MRLEPNPKIVADLERTRTALKKAWERRGVPIRIVASESGVHSNTLLTFINGKIAYPMRAQFDLMKAWALKNKNAKAEPKEQMKSALSIKLRKAYDVQKAAGKNVDEMAQAAGVNRTVLSQLMNGTYTRTLRPYTMESLNSWADRAIR